MRAFEANFDGLVGPTHGYAGLSYGNVASTASQPPLRSGLAGSSVREKCRGSTSIIARAVVPSIDGECKPGSGTARQRVSRPRIRSIPRSISPSPVAYDSLR